MLLVQFLISHAESAAFKFYLFQSTEEVSSAYKSKCFGQLWHRLIKSADWMSKGSPQRKSPSASVCWKSHLIMWLLQSLIWDKIKSKSKQCLESQNVQTVIQALAPLKKSIYELINTFCSLYWNSLPCFERYSLRKSENLIFECFVSGEIEVNSVEFWGFGLSILNMNKSNFSNFLRTGEISWLKMTPSSKISHSSNPTGFNHIN